VALKAQVVLVVVVIGRSLVLLEHPIKVMRVVLEVDKQVMALLAVAVVLVQ
jgi:hypothetical protein